MFPGSVLSARCHGTRLLRRMTRSPRETTVLQRKVGSIEDHICSTSHTSETGLGIPGVLTQLYRAFTRFFPDQ